MSKHPTGLESIERQLRIHDLRLTKLRAWRSAVVATLAKYESENGPRPKTMDTTPDSRTLVYERDTLDREIHAHGALIALGRNRHALELLDSVAGDLALAREAAPDPIAFARARGIELPNNTVVGVRVVAGRVIVQVDYVDRSFAASLTFP